MRHRVTRGGMLFMLALLLTGAGAFVSANNLLFLVFSSMLALLLVSGFISRLVLAGLELELILPEHVSAKSATPAVVRITNLKYLTPSFSIELAGRKDPLNNTPSILTGPVYFPLIPGRTTIDANVPVTFPWRGRHHDNLFALSTKFPFGFLRKSARVTLHRETIVYPSLEPHPEAEALLEDVAGEVEAQTRGSGLDFYRLRPYEMTDSARLVDWKSTAHTGNLQVREFSREELRSVEIYLDRRVPADRNDWFERAVEQCAYLVWNLSELELSVTLRSQGGEEMDVYAALRYLALVEPIFVSPPVAGGNTNNRGTLTPVATGDRKAGGFLKREMGRLPAAEVAGPEDPNGVHIVFTLTPEAFADAGWRVEIA